MSAGRKRLLTPQEYLAQERAAPFKSEYYRGETFAMAGAKHQHCLVKVNLAGETRSGLKDGACQVMTSDMRVKVDATGLYTYPDIVIVCDRPKFEDNVFDTLLNPLVLIEVLSDSTEGYDRGPKFAQYRRIPSLREFVLAAADRVRIERYIRQPDDNWLLTEFADANGEFAFASVPVRVSIAEVYRGVEFPDPPPR
jgi:Uma2 family endonuclease